jgi:hypothetical protein
MELALWIKGCLRLAFLCINAYAGGCRVCPLVSADISGSGVVDFFFFFVVHKIGSHTCLRRPSPVLSFPVPARPMHKLSAPVNKAGGRD